MKEVGEVKDEGRREILKEEKSKREEGRGREEYFKRRRQVEVWPCRKKGCVIRVE